MPIEDLSQICAKQIARKLGNSGGWRDFVAGAYFGIKRARESGISESCMLNAARYGIIDLGRAEEGTRRKYKLTKKQFSNIRLPDDDIHTSLIGKGGMQERYIEDTRDYTKPINRMLEIWGETKSLRLQLSIRDRVVLYLYTIESLTMFSIAEVLKVSETSVYYSINRSKEYINDGFATDDTNSQVQKEERNRESESSTTMSEIQHAEYASEGDRDSCEVGNDGKADDEDTVIESSKPLNVDGCGTDERGKENILSGIRETGLGSESKEKQGTDGSEDTRSILTYPETSRSIRGRRSVDTVSSAIPEDVGQKARVLRESMLDSIGSQDIEDVIQSVLKRAKKGNLQAAKLLISLLGGGK